MGWDVIGCDRMGRDGMMRMGWDDGDGSPAMHSAWHRQRRHDGCCRVGMVPEFRADFVWAGSSSITHALFCTVPKSRESFKMRLFLGFFFPSFDPWVKTSKGAGLQLEAKACALLSCCELEWLWGG